MLLAAEEAGDLSGIAREDLSKEGVEQGKDGLVGYLRWAAKCEPKAFLHILGKPQNPRLSFKKSQVRLERPGFENLRPMGISTFALGTHARPPQARESKLSPSLLVF